MAERIIELEIEGCGADGEGLARHGGQRVYVPFAYDGEAVRVRLAGPRPGGCDAELIEVLRPNPGRRPAACPHFGFCGGCQLQGLSYAEQTRIKLEAARRDISRDMGRDPASLDLGLVQGREYGYRNRFQFFSQRGGLALKTRGGLGYVQLSSCPIASDEVNQCLGAAGKNGLAPASEGLRLDVFASPRGCFMEGRETDARAMVLGHEIGFPLPGFFQSNLGMLETLLSDILSLGLGGNGRGRMVELYAGVGSLSLFLSRGFGQLCLVEENPAAVAWAERNFRAAYPQGDGPRRECMAMKVEDWISLPKAKDPIDLLVCDPPRAGLSQSLRGYLARYRPRHLAYLSCNPRSLSRDLGKLCAEAYRPTMMRAYDFYPQTPHLEVLALLEARS